MTMHDEMAAFDKLLEGMLLAIEGQADQLRSHEDENKALLQCLMLKLWKGLATLRGIHQPCQIVIHGQGAGQFVDYSSVAVLARTALENYLIIEWLFGSHPDDMTAYRKQLWIYGGHISRADHRPTKEPEIQMSKDAFELAEMMKPQIEAGLKMHYPEVYADRRGKSNILNGHWTRVFTYQKLAEEAGHHADFFKTVYSVLSGHAHTNFNSAFQAANLSNVDQQVDLAEAITSLLLPVMAHTLVLYKGLAPGAAKALSEAPGIVDLAEEYRIEKKHMEGTFEKAWRRPKGK
jgi:hypothetical protein